MSIHLRPLALPDEMERVAELLTVSRREEITVAMLQEREERRPTVRGLRLAAMNELGRMAGFGQVLQLPGAPAGRFDLTLAVEPGAKGQGIGTRLLGELEQYARQEGALSLSAEVRDDDCAAFAFMQHWGYALERGLYQAVLVLEGFDPGRWGGHVERIQAEGIRFFTLAEERSEALEQQLYALLVAGQADIPGNQEEQPPFPIRRQMVLDRKGLPPGGFHLAARGDQLVGFTCLEPLPDGSMQHLLTVVDQACRNQGIALALKVRAAETARAQGVSEIYTYMDSRNRPMIRLNRKLGYVALPGFLQVVKLL